VVSSNVVSDCGPEFPVVFPAILLTRTCVLTLATVNTRGAIVTSLQQMLKRLQQPSHRVFSVHNTSAAASALLSVQFADGCRHSKFLLHSYSVHQCYLRSSGNSIGTFDSCVFPIRFSSRTSAVINVISSFAVARRCMRL